MVSAIRPPATITRSRWSNSSMFSTMFAGGGRSACRVGDAHRPVVDLGQGAMRIRKGVFYRTAGFQVLGAGDLAFVMLEAFGHDDADAVRRPAHGILDRLGFRFQHAPDA